MRKKIEYSKELNFYIEFIDCTDEEYINHMKRKYWTDVDIEDHWNWCYTCEVKDEDNYLVIWCWDKSYNTIAHEVSHAILDILKLKDIEYSESSKEIFTYYLWYWIQRGILFFKKH